MTRGRPIQTIRRKKLALTEAEKNCLVLFADNNEHAASTIVREIAPKIKARGSASGTIRRLHTKNYLSLRWTRDELFYTITESGLAALRAMEAKDGR